MLVIDRSRANSPKTDHVSAEKDQNNNNGLYRDDEEMKLRLETDEDL